VVGLSDVAQAARLAAQRVAAGGLPPLSAPRVGGEDEGAEGGGGVVVSLLPRGGGVGLRRLLVRAVAAAPPGRGYVGVDGGQRLLESDRVLVGVFSAGVGLVDGAVVAGSYPYTGLHGYVDAGGLPVAALAPGLGVGGVVAEEPLVDTGAVAEAVCPGGSGGGVCRVLRELGYGRGYDVSTMMYENRVLVENAALRAAAAAAPAGGVVVVDGPLYYTPGLLVSFYSMARSARIYRPLVELVYVLSYLATVADRWRSLSEALRSAGLVVGVSKRVNRSRLLVNAVRNHFSSRGGGSPPPLPSYDPALAWELARPLLGRLGSSPQPVGVAVGPFYTVVRVRELVERVKAVLFGRDGGVSVLYYALRPFRRGPGWLRGASLADLFERELPPVLVKRSYYLYVGSAARGVRLFRVEFPWEGEMGGGSGFSPPPSPPSGDMEVLRGLAWLASRPYALPAPLPVVLADRVAKEVSRLLAALWFRSLSGRVVFSYETLMEVAG
jgi:hypothetical protein